MLRSRPPFKNWEFKTTQKHGYANGVKINSVVFLMDHVQNAVGTERSLEENNPQVC